MQLDAIGEYFMMVGAAEAGSGILRRIRQTAERLNTFPGIGKRGSVTGTRELPVKGLPYLIVYERVQARNEIVILNVWHCAQNR